MFYILTFSFLPHKELRFIFYVLPFLNVTATATCNYLWIRRGKSFIHSLLAVGLIFHLVVNLVLTTGLLIISAKNYPGGQSLLALQKALTTAAAASEEDSSIAVAASRPVINIHIDVYPAQTGITRFLEVNNPPSLSLAAATDENKKKLWNYDKTEGLNHTELLKYDYLLVQSKDEVNFYKTHEVLLVTDGFFGIDFKFNRFPPVKVKTEHAVTVLRRKQQIIY